jgi:hypothetical protein
MDLPVGVQRSKNVGLMMREKALVMGFSDSKKGSFHGTKMIGTFKLAWHRSRLSNIAIHGSLVVLTKKTSTQELIHLRKNVLIKVM